MQAKSVGIRFAGFVNPGFLVGVALFIGGLGDSRSLAQEAVPRASRPATREQREIESLRREVAELRELVRKLQENITSRGGGHIGPAVDLTWPETLKVRGTRPEILEEPRGHLLFPIQIERANFPAPRSLRKHIEDTAPAAPKRPLRPGIFEPNRAQ